MPVKTKTKRKSVKRKAKLTSRGFFRRPSRARFLVFIAIFATIGVATALLSKAATGDGSIPVYRFFQNTSSEHMFTDSAAEVAALPKAGFSNEGVAFSAWPDANDGRKPVYRLIPKAGGKHIFTASEVEKNNLVNNGWNLEGVAFYAYDAAGAGRIPTYRLAKSNGDHLFTTSGFEKDQLTSPGGGYSLEGIAFYASGSVPVQNVHTPIGSLDASGCGTAVGWALDGDNLTTTVRIDIYVDDTGISTAPTNLARADVNRIYYATGNHGYSVAFPDRYKDGKAHRADVYAINVDSEGKVNGTNVKIGTKQFACNQYGQDAMPQILAKQATDVAAAAAKAEQQRAYTAAATAAKQLMAEPNLQQGSSEPAVAAFQQRLDNRGLSVAADGNFNSATDHAVRAFSIEIGLGNTGVVDSRTYQAMKDAEANGWQFNPNDPLLAVLQPSSPTPAVPVVVVRGPALPPVSACGPAFTVAQCTAFGIYISQPAPAANEPKGNCFGWSQNSDGSWNQDFGIYETKSQCINEQFTANGANSQHIDWNGEPSPVWTRPAPTSNTRNDPTGNCQFYGFDAPNSGNVVVIFQEQITRNDCISDASTSYDWVNWNGDRVYTNYYYQ